MIIYTQKFVKYNLLEIAIIKMYNTITLIADYTSETDNNSCHMTIKQIHIDCAIMCITLHA